MTTATLPLVNNPTDAELVAASRRGDRAAFGQIVQRYQAMITGLLYASCGDIHRSEDLAQETFVSAWKSLSGLREPGKLVGWLCQIARHRLLDGARGAARVQNLLKNAAREREDSHIGPPADQQIMSEEERELLWRTLANIPQPYRETIVLYYRQGQSTADVAAAMETTEESVRQRLARGRQMLREHVAAMIERDLVRSAPNTAFTVAVVAALPALAIQSAKAATIGAAAKGAGAAAGGNALWFVSMAVGPVLAIWAGIFGTRASLRAAQSRTERRLIVRTFGMLVVLILLAMACMQLLPLIGKRLGWGAAGFSLSQAAFFVVSAGIFVGFIVWRNTKHRALRKSEGRIAGPPIASEPSGTLAGEAKLLRKVAVPVATLGVLGPFGVMAFQAGDTLGTVTILAAIVTISIGMMRYTRGLTPEQAARTYPIWALALGLVLFVMMNWRFSSWIAILTDKPLDEIARRIPRWTINVQLIAIIIWVEAMMIVPLWLRKRNLMRDSAAEAPPPATDPR